VGTVDKTLFAHLTYSKTFLLPRKHQDTKESIH
jgi:hypothetical protein